ncbi:hypothetical protein BDV93DRAFT_542498 [Ceratobasidium sp. AG-I]|nr:hypothetical protein BDV93DRAFT_542498 [Ceratobasidium sp. AG-I]
MASRLGFRLAARSLRQPTVLSVRFTGRRAMSSGPPKESSDTIWAVGALIGTVGGLAAIFSSSGSKDVHHESSHAPKPKKEAPKEEENKAEEKSDDSEGKGADKAEGDVSPEEAQASLKKSVKSDDPSSAKAEEAKSSGSSKSDGADSDSETAEGFVKIEDMLVENVKEALARSETVDVPAVAKGAEEKKASK